MKKLILALLFSLIFTSCCFFDCSNCPPLDRVSSNTLIKPTSFELIHTAESTNVVQSYAVEMENKNKLFLQRAKTYYDGGIHAIQLEFITQDIMEIKEARELIVDMTEDLLARLNQNPLLAQDFANYPFRPANLEIYVTFESYFGKYVDPYYVRWICMEDGHVAFYSFDILDNTKNKWHVRHEEYATSREVVVYHREAERSYEEINNPKEDIFGDQRYYSKYPKNIKPGI